MRFTDEQGTEWVDAATHEKLKDEVRRMLVNAERLVLETRKMQALIARQEDYLRRHPDAYAQQLIDYMDRTETGAALQ